MLGKRKLHCGYRGLYLVRPHGVIIGHIRDVILKMRLEFCAALEQQFNEFLIAGLNGILRLRQIIAGDVDIISELFQRAYFPAEVQKIPHAEAQPQHPAHRSRIPQRAQRNSPQEKNDRGQRRKQKRRADNAPAKMQIIPHSTMYPIPTFVVM